MPSTKRSATAGSPEAIAEDVRAIREGGGVSHADDQAFSATIAMLDPAQPINADNRRMAENLVLTYVRRVAAAARTEGANDPCQLAAARSFETIFSLPADDSRLVASVRRAAKAEYECSLSLDGIRKREDGLLNQLARQVHADLVEAQESRGPQTVEELARYIIDDVRDAFEDIDDGLRRVYKVWPMPDSRSLNSIVLSMMYSIAHMQFSFGRVIATRLRVQQHSRIDFLFADAASVVMSQAFGHNDDRSIVHDVLTAVGRLKKRDFLEQILAHPNGDDIFRRFTEWVSSCHPQCAYQRTYNVGLLCAPHQLVFALYMFIDVHADLLSGELEEDLVIEFNQ